MPPSVDLSVLRRSVAALEPGLSSAAARFAFGADGLDAWLGGGLACGVLHEVQSVQARHPGAALGFGLGMAARAAKGRPFVWVRQDRGEGELYGEGLAAFGLDPRHCLVVRAAQAADVLRAADEAARCSGLGAALVEIRGNPRVLDLTASRRLALAADASGVTLVLIRLGAEPAPSAATSRWRVGAAASTPLAANAPGRPAFAAALLRHRSGLGPRDWRLEWDRDRKAFAAPSTVSSAIPALPRSAVSVPARGSAAAPDGACVRHRIG